MTLQDGFCWLSSMIASSIFKDDSSDDLAENLSMKWSKTIPEESTYKNKSRTIKRVAVKSYVEAKIYASFFFCLIEGVQPMLKVIVSQNLLRIFPQFSTLKLPLSLSIRSAYHR